MVPLSASTEDCEDLLTFVLYFSRDGVLAGEMPYTSVSKAQCVDRTRRGRGAGAGRLGHCILRAGHLGAIIVSLSVSGGDENQYFFTVDSEDKVIGGTELTTHANAREEG